MLRFFNRKIKIGKNNYISKHAIIHDNVQIGDNNKIYDNVTIFPNTIIGDNNYFYPRNYIGDFPIDSRIKNCDYDFSNVAGVSIGNNNLFHLDNVILSGTETKTQICDNNKILGKVLVGHDVILKNNVVIYPGCIIGGYANLLNNSSVGMGSIVNQKIIIGNNSMIGSNNAVTKHVFPYYITINNKLIRLNKKNIKSEMECYDKELKEIQKHIHTDDFNINNFNISDEIKENILDFLIKTKQFKQ